MARGRTLGKMLRMAVICLTIGVLLGMSPALVNPAAGGYEPGDTLGGAAPISTDTMEFMPQASISGVVKNESDAPIVGAMVSAVSVVFPFPDYGVTGADGSYSISISMPGNYFVWAQASGYVTEYYNNVYDPSLATEVASGATNIDFTLGLAGSISGVVKDGAGNPIRSALVNAEDDDFTGYDYTGADGTYSIAGLTPDSYVVWAEANGYATEYYNNVYDRLSATAVEVTPSSDQSGIDFTLGVPDVTPPTTPVVNDDGATTTSTSQLHATWSSSDPESGISEYQYAIGTTAGGIDVVAWTSAGTNTQVTKTGLGLTVGTTYYFSVKARNGAGLWSGVGVSDGIQVIATTTPPAVTTNDASSVATTSARLNGNLTSLGTASSVTVSFVWGTTLGGPYPNETTSQAKTSTGTFYFNLPGLAPGTDHYYKAKAVGDGTSYGAEKSFTTTTTPPTVTTDNASDIYNTSATLNGILEDLGTAPEVWVSFEWGVTTGYDNFTDPQKMTAGAAFSANISGLTQDTTYYYRAKAVGHGAPVYGSGMNFTTGPSPSVVTYAASDVTTSSARLNGNLTSLGTADNVTVSFVWGTTLGGPYPNETTSENMTSTGTFYFDQGGLDPTTIYYYQAKAVGNGTSHGMEMSFNTFPPSPLVTTGDASSITADSARLNGDLTWLGTASSVQVSFQWGASSGSYDFETTSENMTSTGAFHFDLPGLIPGATYYYRAKAVGDGTSYGTERSFNTTAIPPSVTTDNASDVTTSSARLQGNLTGLGTASSVTVSFVWGTSSGSYPNETTGQAMTSTGIFYFDLNSLDPGTTYYYRAKAVGQGSPVYGSDKSFVSHTPPSVTTVSASNLATTSARLNGDLTSKGTAGSVTVSFVWGTSPGSYPNETTSENMTSTGLFSADLPGLSPGTTYYCQAKAVGHSTVYGVERSFTTSSPPSVATNAATQVTANSARLNGELISLGTASSVTVSFSWGTSPGSYPNETAGVAKTAAGTFYFDLTGLSPNTAYYYQAKAVGDSTVYGAERTLATGQTPEIEAVDPSSGKQGQHLTITILGSNFDGATGVRFGSGITVEGFNVNSSNAITARIAIDKGAEVGARDVSVTTGGGTGTDTDGFGVGEGGGLPFWLWIAVGISGALAVSVLAYFVARGRTTRQNR